MKQISFIIVNYKTPELVMACIESLIPQITEELHEIIVVDNCSPDDSADILSREILTKSWQNKVRLVLSPENNGFSAGNNAGIEVANGEYYWLCNSDTYFRDDSISIATQILGKYENAAMITPRLEHPGGEVQTSCFRNHTPLTEFLAVANTGVISNRFKKSLVPIDPVDEATYPPWSSFASIIIKSDAFNEIGIMDEGFFMYFEDMDYCIRARNKGWKVVNDPSVSVVHLRGGSSDVKAASKELRRRPRYYYAARSRYFAKYYGVSGLWFTNFLWYVGRSISFVRELVGNKEKHICAGEWIDIWTNAFDPLNKSSSNR